MKLFLVRYWSGKGLGHTCLIKAKDQETALKMAAMGLALKRTYQIKATELSPDDLMDYIMSIPHNELEITEAVGF
jgi:hypothetical protein